MPKIHIQIALIVRVANKHSNKLRNITFLVLDFITKYK